MTLLSQRTLLGAKPALNIEKGLYQYFNSVLDGVVEQTAFACPSSNNTEQMWRQAKRNIS